MATILERRKPGLYRVRNEKDQFIGKIQQEGPGAWVYHDYRTDATIHSGRLRDLKKAAAEESKKLCAEKGH